MNEPTVCCIMLTRDRPELAKRAAECFRRQTYKSKLLIVVDSSAEYQEAVAAESYALFHRRDFVGKPIGELRNWAASQAVRIAGESACPRTEVFMHWDDDDWSHPNRIAEQVALLQSSGADVVGYNEMLFWRERHGGEHGASSVDAGSQPAGSNPAFRLHSSARPRTEVHWDDDDWSHPKRVAEQVALLGELRNWAASQAESACEAWLYTGATPRQALGTSLCYWRKTWEARPFNPQLPRNKEGSGEDWDFLRDRKIAVASAIGNPYPMAYAPRMIARIHGGNTSNGYSNLEESPSWRRVPHWDHWVRQILS